MLAAYQEVLRRARLIALGAILFALIVFIGTFLAFLRTPLVAEDGKAINFVFPVGSSIINLTEQLQNMGLLDYPRTYLVLLSSLMKVRDHLHAGEYQILPGTTPITLLQKMVAGDVVWRDFLLLEGSTFEQFRKFLDENPYLVHKTRNLNESQIAKLLKIPHDQLEGLFFPDTYRYTAGLYDTMLLKKAYELMQHHLQQNFATRSPNLPYKNAYQALIVASMVEKEAKLPEDRPRIAGVILKRLKLGMPLQIDATVIYGLDGAYDGKLKLVQLKIPGPYNTYLNKGLPPTPIALPSLASIVAATHPIIDKNLYYVARGDGGHVFSQTYAEQNKAVKQYYALEKKHAKAKP